MFSKEKLGSVFTKKYDIHEAQKNEIHGKNKMAEREIKDAPKF